MSEPATTVYQSIRGGDVRESITGVVVRPADTADAPAGVWLIEAGPGHAPPGFAPRAGDRLRDPAGNWWRVTDAGKPDDGGVCRLTCVEDAGP